jgi:hypothetical protein
VVLFLGVMLLHIDKHSNTNVLVSKKNPHPKDPFGSAYDGKEIKNQNRKNITFCIPLHLLTFVLSLIFVTEQNCFSCRKFFGHEKDI